MTIRFNPKDKYGQDRQEPDSPRALCSRRRLPFSLTGGLSLSDLMAMPRGTPIWLFEAQHQPNADWALFDIYATAELAAEQLAAYRGRREYRTYDLRIRRTHRK